MRTLILLLLVVFLPLSPAANADENLKKGLAKAQYMLRQAMSEKSAMQKELAELKAELESRDKALATANKDLRGANKRIEKLRGNIGVWQEEYEGLKDRLSETRGRLGEALAYGNVQDERFSIQSENFALCRANNEKLAGINQELVAAYQDKTAMDALQQRDPFFGLKAVEVENLVQDYQYRIEDLNLSMNEYMLGDPGQAPERSFDEGDDPDESDLEG